MNERQKQLLKTLVREYIDCAQPVSSSFLANRFSVSCSSATIRNECVALAQEGYIRKAYCSSGSVPTNKAYRFFVDERSVQGVADTPHITRVAKNHVRSNSLSDIATELAEQARLFTLLIDEDLDVAMDGMGYLFAQPDFASPDDLKQLAEFIDATFDKREQIFQTLHGHQLSVFIGHENPIFMHQDNVSWIARSCATPEHKQLLISLVGPTRMAYDKNLSLLSSWVDDVLHI